MTLLAPGPYASLCYTPRTAARRVIDELEVGAQAAKAWAWTDHYCPPAQYVRIRQERNERSAAPAPRRTACTQAATPAPEPLGQLNLFAPLTHGG